MDTFTYYLADQQSAIDANISVTDPVIATVTIDIRPVNDAPLAAHQSFTALESQPTPAIGDPPQVGRGQNPVTITATDLLRNARAHQNPQYPSAAAPTAPWDETDQSLRVVEIILPAVLPDGSFSAAGQVINASDADAAGQVILQTVRGTLVARFVTQDTPQTPFIATVGSLIDLTYTSDDYLNRDNVALIPASVTGRGVDSFDFFRFTIEDDGLLIDPGTVDDSDFSIVEDDQFNVARLRHTAVALLDVAPQNDYPIPTNDVISVGTIGAGISDPTGSLTSIDPNTDWSQYFISLGMQPLSVPVPLEDSILVIPAGFLLRNDLAGQVISVDENGMTLGKLNDGALRIASATLVTAPASGGGSISVNAAGNVVFRAPTDYYGDIVFTYVVQDSGIDEAVAGSRVIAPLTATGTVTVAVQPVNDAPIPFD
ncbi:MAG: hypothetical protein EHM77_02660, partial [Planctomycetaceae bacterium]